MKDPTRLILAGVIAGLGCGGEPAGSSGVEVPSLNGEEPGGPSMTDQPTPGVRPPATCSPSAQVEPRLYQLSAAQYGNALRDLLELPESPIVVGDTEATLLFYPREDAPVQASIAEGFSRASRDVLSGVDMNALSGCAASQDAMGGRGNHS